MYKNQHNDNILAALLKKGDKDAYTVIYTTYYNKLCVYVYTLCNDSKKAEDIVQNVFTKLWVNRKKITIHSSLKAYLYRSAHNAFLDDCKTLQKRYKLADQLRMEAVIEFEEADNSTKDKRLKELYRTIDTLPKKRKQIFIMNKLQSLKYKEIAAILKISERTVESQIRKALITIRNVISSD